jgi:hypothetical protein
MRNAQEDLKLVTSFSLQRAAGMKHHDHLGLLCLELHIGTRQNLRPDPDHDRYDRVYRRYSNFFLYMS